MYLINSIQFTVFHLFIVIQQAAQKLNLLFQLLKENWLFFIFYHNIAFDVTLETKDQVNNQQTNW